MNVHHIDASDAESFIRLCERERRQFPRSPLPAPERVERFVGRDFLLGADPFDTPLEQGDLP